MSLRNFATVLSLGLTTIGAAAVAGCASTPPPIELVDARRSYASAQQGQANVVVPAEVLVAKQALDRAEASYASDPDAPRTRDLAYVAQRKAMIAEAKAAISADMSAKERADADLQGAQKAELSQARQQLNAQGQLIAAQGQELTAEQRARRAAEQRAASALASLEKIAAVKDEARGLVITLSGSVLFATNQAALLPIAEDRLNQVAQALNENNPQSTFVVEGHTDSTGAQAANEALSLHRAESVRAFLVAHGVDAQRIRAVGLGSSRPVADNKSPEGRANNRRVEIVVERGAGTR